MKALTTTSTSSPPAIISQGLDTTIRRLTSRLEEIPGDFRHLAISDRHAPSDAEYAALRKRLAELTASLMPGSLDDLEYEITMLRTAFGSAATDEIGASFAARLAAKALDRYPAWAVKEACERVLTGRAETIPVGPHMPGPPQLAAECRAIVQPIHDEKAGIDRILAAHVYRERSPEEIDRCRAVARWQDMRGDFTKGGAETGGSKESPDDALDRLSKTASAPVVIGEGLSAKIADMTGGKPA